MALHNISLYWLTGHCSIKAIITIHEVAMAQWRHATSVNLIIICSDWFGPLGTSFSGKLIKMQQSPINKSRLIYFCVDKGRSLYFGLNALHGIPYVAAMIYKTEWPRVHTEHWYQSRHTRRMFTEIITNWQIITARENWVYHGWPSWKV